MYTARVFPCDTCVNLCEFTHYTYTARVHPCDVRINSWIYNLPAYRKGIPLRYTCNFTFLNVKKVTYVCRKGLCDTNPCGARAGRVRNRRFYRRFFSALITGQTDPEFCDLSRLYVCREGQNLRFLHPYGVDYLKNYGPGCHSREKSIFSALSWYIFY